MELLRAGTKSKDKTIKKYRPLVKGFFDDQTFRILDRYNEYLGIKAIKSDLVNPNDLDVLIEYIFPVDQENIILKANMKPLHTSAVQKSIDDIDLVTGASISAGLSNPEVLAAISDLGNKITRINTKTKLILREVIAQGIADGENIYSIADRIKETGLDEWYQGRALTIARTETRLGYDHGGKIAYEGLGAQSFSVVGCVGTLAGANDFGYTASYGDFSETIGSCGVTEMPFNIWDDIEGVHHPNHNGVQIADYIN